MGNGQILIVEDDETLRRVTQAQLADAGYAVSAAADGAKALEILHAQPHDLVITDLNLPDVSGLELLKIIHAGFPETAVVILTAYGSVGTAVDAIKLGAYDYLTKPVHPEEIRALVARVLERHRLLEEIRTLRTAIDGKFGFRNIIGSSNALIDVLSAAAVIAPTDANVLICGETGTGKEILAKAIHLNSPRRDKPFVIINCGSIPRELLESELFGHLKGSFTGALTHKKGKVEIADGGTLFLDEIGEMPLDLQVRILRLVQEHEIEKVGSTKTEKVDVRIIAATHRNLETRVAEGHFREDLFYRLSVIPITLPALRQRKDDIPLLIGEFFTRSKNKHGKPGLSLPPELMPNFVNYAWPGNIRELENVVERIVLLSSSDGIRLAHLPESLRGGPKSTVEVMVEKETDTIQIPVDRDIVSLDAVEREVILRGLHRFDWNLTQAARYLDVSRKALRYRIAKHRISKESTTASLPQTRAVKPEHSLPHGIEDGHESERNNSPEGQIAKTAEPRHLISSGTETFFTTTS